jgi:hypothetical protein
MPLSKESEEIAEIKYEIAFGQVKKKYAELTRQIELNYRTSSGRQREILKLLPPRLEETAKALLDCYFERYEADGLLPQQADLERLDKKIENIFCGGYGDYSGAIDLDTKCEVDRLEQQAQKHLKVRALELKLRKSSADTYEMNINNNYGPVMQGPNNVQNLSVRTTNGSIHIKWSQLKPEIGVQRISEIGDVEVTERDRQRAVEIGGDPWVELCDATGFGAIVRKYALGLFTPE